MPEFGTTMSKRPSLLKSPMATECGRESKLSKLRVDDVRTKPHFLPKQNKRYKVEYSEIYFFMVI